MKKIILILILLNVNNAYAGDKLSNGGDRITQIGINIKDVFQVVCKRDYFQNDNRFLFNAKKKNYCSQNNQVKFIKLYKNNIFTEQYYFNLVKYIIQQRPFVYGYKPKIHYFSVLPTKRQLYYREVDFLLQKKLFDINYVDQSGKTLFHYANADSFYELLIQHGIDLTRKDKYGRTLLHYINKFIFYEYLYKGGYNILEKDYAGETFLYRNPFSLIILDDLRMICCNDSNVSRKTIEFESSLFRLKQMNIPFNDVNNNNETYWHHIEYGLVNEETIKIMLDYGIDFTIQDINGDTILHRVFKQFNKYKQPITMTVLELEKIGLDLGIKNNNGVSILDLMKK